MGKQQIKQQPMNEKQCTINVSNLSSGVYIVEVIDGNHRMVERLVVE